MTIELVCRLCTRTIGTMNFIPGEVGADIEPTLRWALGLVRLCYECARPTGLRAPDAWKESA